MGETFSLPTPPRKRRAACTACPSFWHADAEQESVLLDRRARDEEQDDPVRGRGDPPERLTQQVDHLTHGLARGDSVADPDRAAEKAFVWGAQPLEPVEHARVAPVGWSAVEHADGAQDVLDPVDVPRDRIRLYLTDPPGLGDHRGNAARRR